MSSGRVLRIGAVGLAAIAFLLVAGRTGPWARQAAVAPGTWSRLAPAPIEPDNAVSVWTGKQMLVFGRVTSRAANGAVLTRVDVGASYDPLTGVWRRLPSPGPSDAFMSYRAVWTGKEMLVWGQGLREAFNPATGRWRRFPPPPLAGHDGAALVVWTGRELIGWGGGCCGDAFSDGAAYNPTTNTWRKLPRPPVGGQQSPTGVWTGRELVVVNGRDADGKAVGGAAYSPATDTWRRIASLPASHYGGNAVWNGRDVLVVGGETTTSKSRPPAPARTLYAYNPGANRWRQLRSLQAGRAEAAAVWTGRQLLVWGGETGSAGSLYLAPYGLAYDPTSDRWSQLPPAPLQGRLDPTAVWSGHRLIVWGGEPLVRTPPGTVGASDFWPSVDGAIFTPRSS
jgi:N-acetylneuraminic acid mutarotase